MKIQKFHKKVILRQFRVTGLGFGEGQRRATSGRSFLDTDMPSAVHEEEDEGKEGKKESKFLALKKKALDGKRTPGPKAAGPQRGAKGGFSALKSRRA